MWSTGLIIISSLVLDFPRGACCAWTKAPGGGYCAANPTWEEHFTGRGEGKKSEACSGEESQDHGADVCLTESIHQGEFWITSINGNWQVYSESIVHLDSFLRVSYLTKYVVLGKTRRTRANASGQAKVFHSSSSVAYVNGPLCERLAFVTVRSGLSHKHGIRVLLHCFGQNLLTQWVCWHAFSRIGYVLFSPL